MNYLLTCWGSFDDNLKTEVSDLCRIFATNEVVGFEKLGDTYVFYFNSDIDDDLIVTELIEMFHDKMHFMFVEFSDRVSGFMPTEVSERIMDVFMVNENHGLKLEEYIEEDDDDSEDIDEITYLRVKNNLERQLKKPTLDYLLEQIKTKGLSSLTKYEKSILDEYATEI